MFLEDFTKIAMPIINNNFKNSMESCTNLLKTLQSGTRILQNIASHSKVTKDNVLTANVPLLKKSLEMLLSEVKIMLDGNGCLNAFWIGNLKHRDISGEEVGSQMPIEIKKKRKIDTQIIVEPIIQEEIILESEDDLQSLDLGSQL
jgi:hypothetical protein